MVEVQSPNIFGGFMAGRQARQAEEQQALQNQFAQRRMGMQEMEFQAQQEALARQQQFNQLAGQYLGQGTVDMAGGLQVGDGTPQQHTAQAHQQKLFSQLAAIDPQRALQMQQVIAQQSAALRDQQRKQAEEVVTRARYALQSDAPATLLRIGFPEFAKQLADKGVDVENLDDDTVRGYAQTLIEQFAPVAGITPDKLAGDQFTLGEGQTRFDAQGRPIASVAKQPSAEEENRGFARANVLRDEFNASSKDYGTVLASYETIRATAKQPSAAGDISLLTSYMKMVDPGSTVREGEFATAQNAGGVSARARAKYNSLLSGERLTEEQRADFVNQAKNMFESRDTQYKQTREKYSTLAKRAGVDPIDVVGEEEVVAESREPKQGNAPAAALQYLQANPQFRDAFREKYGYLPAGM